MTETGQQPFTTPGTDRGSSRSDAWSRRPRRSRTDSKIAGVAGGLARYLGVDPILFRVGFVALTILGGVGVLAYCLLWLLLPAEGDEVSAGEALIGRGRSSVSPALAVFLALVVLASVSATFSWGMPFWPGVIIVLIALHIARKQRRGPFRPGSEWEQRFRSNADPSSFTGNPFSRPDGGRAPWTTGTSGDRYGARGGWGCSSHSTGWGPGPRPGAPTDAPTSGFPADDAASPFDRPAFWDDPAAGPGPAGPQASTTASAEPRTTPPAWDPLGAAPFAWDLPDIDVSTPSDRAAVVTRRPRPVIARATLGLALLTVATQVLGLMFGWWTMSWAAIGGTALAIVAVGLLIQSVAGRPITLAFPGLVLSVATVGLALTGLTGTITAGQSSWAPTTIEAVQSSYKVGAGQITLDLSKLELTEGEHLTTSVEVNAGQAKVVLPEGVNVDVNCSANVGQVACVGVTADGFDNERAFTDHNPEYSGTITLDVAVGAGDVQVTRG